MRRVLLKIFAHPLASLALAFSFCSWPAFSAPASAQELDCAPTDLLRTLSAAAKLLPAQSIEEQRDTLRVLRLLLAKTEAKCQGWYFTSEEEGMQPILGPIILPQGSHSLTVETMGYFNAALELEAGLCAYRDRSAGAFSRGQASGGAARIIDVSSPDCQFLLAISSANEPWTLHISEIVNAKTDE